MPYINLIQEQRLTAKMGERQARLFFFGFVGALGASLMGFGYLTFQADGLANEESRLKAKVQKQTPLVRQIEAAKKEAGVIQPKVTTLTGAQEMSAKWGRILGHLTQQTPPQTWLTNLRCSNMDPAKPISVSFSGLSDRQELVGEFILRLQGCEDLGNVALKFTQEKAVSMGRSIEFEVNAELPGTEEKKATKEEKS